MLTSISTRVNPDVLLFRFIWKEDHMDKGREASSDFDTGWFFPKISRSLIDDEVYRTDKFSFLEIAWRFAQKCLYDHHKTLPEIYKKPHAQSGKNKIAIFAF